MKGLSIVKIDGEYYLKFDHSKKGKRSRIFKKCESLAQAKQKLKETEKQIGQVGKNNFRFKEVDDLSTLTPSSSNPTLASYWKVLQVSLASSVRPRTLASYEMCFRLYILPSIGEVPLQALTRKMIKDFIAGLTTRITKRTIKDKETGEKKIVEKLLAKDTIRIILASLSRCLSEAVEDDLISRNFASKAGRQYKEVKRVRAEIEVLNSEELQAFLNAVAEHQPFWYPFFLFSAHTGCRFGEIRGARWVDIDWRGRFIHIKRGLDQKGNIQETKTGRTRKIDLSKALFTVLHDLKEQRKKEGNDSPWIFCNQEGQPVDPSNVKRRVFHKCLSLAGLRRIRFHDLRHSFASILLSSGKSLELVKQALGHSSVRTTSDIYSHYIGGSNTDLVDSLPSAKTVTATNVKKFKTKRG